MLLTGKRAETRTNEAKEDEDRKSAQDVRQITMNVEAVSVCFVAFSKAPGCCVGECQAAELKALIVLVT